MTITNNTTGWTVQEWKKFHSESTPDHSYQVLSDLLSSLAVAPADPAWISICTKSELKHQWAILQSKSDKHKLPLYGVPVAIKDNIDVKDFETTAACPSFKYSPERDSTVAKLLKNAGAIIIGKTNLDQFATGLVGTRSPYGKTPCVFSDQHVSGGSSAGSASVVARGLVPLALGTDTAGSGRVPAMLNNLIGLKPSRGLLSCSGVVPACKSLDCVSIFSTNISDAQLALDILAQPDTENDQYSSSFPSNPLLKFPTTAHSPLKIAVPSELPWYGEVENELLYKNAILDFKNNLNCQIDSIDFAPLLELAKCLYEGPWVVERYVATKEFFQSNPPSESIDPAVSSIIASSKKFTAEDCFNFEYKRQAILQKVNQIISKYPVLIVPTAPLNPTFDQIAQQPIQVNSQQGTWTNFVNLADLSALSIPTGFKINGLPFGITLISQKFNDYALLNLASQYLSALHPNRFIGSLKHKLIGDADKLISNIPKPDLSKSIKLAVVGAHLTGFELHWQLEICNASFIAETKSSSNYKLYALPKTGPVAKPGLRRVGPTESGKEITLEIYSVPIENFGKFISLVPEPLGIGSVELKSGEWVKSFICEEIGYLQKGTKDITEYGGWRNYIESTQALSKAKKKPFETVLVANRGEIAVRIIKSLKKLGIQSVAVYSDLDKYAQHVDDADIAVSLHGTTAAETYLSIDKIIKAAKSTNSQAIIPGYGFLSENADFADRCAQENIVFVGPSSNAIRKLGLKHSARAIAEQANVPLAPGSGLVKTAEEAASIAEKLEYPVMVKSTAGGGGIGLQKVDSPKDIKRVFETVQHQAKSYFGDSGVFLERFVENARHVEVQILGDGYGKAIAVGERDCSLQRRNQKVIEETPAPRLPESTRQKMRKAAEQLASILNYKCAGTVEFIYDEKRDEFYFLEVNTRLQVEHPITEMVTGLDLVEWMIFIAADMPPDFSQKIVVTGASMEARLYAENPVKSFQPSPGQLTDVTFPEWARVDTWVKKGTIISSEYDPTLAKIIVHGKDRNECLQKLRQALDETIVYGCITNVDYLRSIANSQMFAEAKVATKVLDSFDYSAHAFEILSPGAYTTVQDYPGRVGLWRIGVPPSGPMDNYSFRIANRIVGNSKKSPAIEITLSGPTILFHNETVISVTGGNVSVEVNDEVKSMWEPTNIKRGDKLTIGKLTTGCRSYLAIRGGIDVTEYLGSRSTFALGNLGGYNGRVLKLGDVLFLGSQHESAVGTLPTPDAAPSSVPSNLILDLPAKEWTVGVTCGPHGAPDFFKPEYIDTFFKDQWKIHYNSNRFGVRLIGPKPVWARPDGGEAGLHPSNTHDYVYSMGAINFTGDEPVILTVDGPSLGGFVCAAVVAESEMWKIGQVKPGDLVRFVPISYDTARKLKETQDKCIEDLSGKLPTLNKDNVLSKPENPVLAELPATNKNPRVIYRQAGDHYILVEYGVNELDLNLSYRINRLTNMVEQNKTVGIVELSQGVRSVLVEYNGYEASQSQILETLIAYEKEMLSFTKWKVPSKIFRLPMAFEDKKTLAAVTRYQETIRSNAPWLPNNVDFIASVNNINRSDVKDMLYSARFLVLGLGDVFLGAPCAVPLDPRQRYLGTKYNPSRTFTPNGTVGIGGMYMCIYTMESPGGYQLVGRTIPIWDKLSLGAHSTSPWLLTPFDQVEFYPVTEEQIDIMSDEASQGRFKVDIVESVFDHGKYLEWVQENIDSIKEFQDNQGGEKMQEFSRLIQIANAELEKSGGPKNLEEEKFPEGAEMVYSEYSGRFWKPLVQVGDEVKEGQGLIVVEAMKTEMVVNSPKAGKVFKIVHENGDMVEAGDLVVVVE
ncbi:bifunctional urea carboxylase/allophanate hydrolase [Ascoidea rubescens DSM 1968]|uniref:Urea amidolyase n=1 Tax=Ascoidea rubescens DSM 1968 TaxID=1344418 RepID=A0A1D2VQC3_9ASCO|nr:multifunctional urea amidolyase [Ascoidea rubescens DSM 1968]ODV63810.1 multifunctional urea amidolyase [Ascoidea rubescens DSM 1968]